MSLELLKTKSLLSLLLSIGVFCVSCDTPPDFEINCAQIGAVTREKNVTNGIRDRYYKYYIKINGENYEIKDGTGTYLTQNPQIGTGSVIFDAYGVVKSVEISPVCPVN